MLANGVKAGRACQSYLGRGPRGIPFEHPNVEHPKTFGIGWDRHMLPHRTVIWADLRRNAVAAVLSHLPARPARLPGLPPTCHRCRIPPKVRPNLTFVCKGVGNENKIR